MCGEQAQIGPIRHTSWTAVRGSHSLHFPRVSSVSEPQSVSGQVRRTALILWIATGALTLWMALFPFVADLRVVNDDVKFVRGNQNVGTLAENLEFGWRRPYGFRPLEIVIASACDPVTLICWPVVPVQAAGLLVLSWGVIAVCRRAFGPNPVAAPLVLLWVLVSPATMSSLWQMDTCSQTWAAALGLWCAILAFDAMRPRGEVRFQWGKIALLFALSAIAMTVKETHYGWSASIGIALIVAIAMTWKRDRSAAWRGVVALVAVALVPLLYLIARKVLTAGLAHSMVADPEAGRYEVLLEENLLGNVVALAAALLSDGPLHLIMDERANLLLRALAPISALASTGLVFAAAALMLIRHHVPRNVPCRLPLIAAVVCTASVIATVPMGTVSDLYTFGPNVGAGVLLVLAGTLLWNPAEPSDRALTHPIALIAATVLATIGLYGVASRSYHFALTWEYARTLNTIILEHQAAIPPDAVRASPARISYTAECDSGHTYGQVMVDPLSCLGLASLVQWCNARDPDRPIRFLRYELTQVRPGVDLRLDCAALRVRQHW